ncbi:MAG: hypothetical protein E7579_10205 [Ruminococcaceae bacterium]|nr:hypothetical protein [Oscillospiraceae bacterium]
MKSKHALSILLALLMLASAFAGCSESGDPDTVTEELAGEISFAEDGSAVIVDDDEETPADTVKVEDRIKPDIPDGYSFDGHTFTIMNNDYSLAVWSQIDIGAEEMTGEPINDAVFTRNTTVSETYNCSIVSQKTLNLSGELPTLVKAGDSSVDLATVHLRTFASHAQSNNYVELNGVSTLDLAKPWYDQNSVKELSFNKKLFGVATDLTTMDEQATTAMVFNKDLYKDYQIADTYGDFYQLVKDNKWTFDVMEAMATSVSADLDGDGQRTEKDLYGMFYQRDTLTSLLNGFGVLCATKNADDIPEMTLMTERNVDILDRLFDLLYQPDYCLNVMAQWESTSDWTLEMVNAYDQNQALLMWIRLADVENLRSMDIDFGIVPIPMYDESQGGYKISVNPYVGTVTCIPQSNYDPEATGYFIEAISSESRYVVLPEYYEINLKGKVARDQESAEMLDLIFANRIYDLGQIYDPGNFSNTIIYMTMTNDRDVASKWAKNEKAINKMLDKMIEKFQ